MSDSNNPAQSQWQGMGVFNNQPTADTPPADLTALPEFPGEANTEATGEVKQSTSPDTMRRRGFFEAIKDPITSHQHLTSLLKEYELQTASKINAVDDVAEKRLIHLNRRIADCHKRIMEIGDKISEAQQYQEENDPKLQAMLSEKSTEEEKLCKLQGKLTETRIELGNAKSSIMQKSLEEANMQVQTALNIQKNIYSETRELNRMRFEDEKNNLTHLSDAYGKLYICYEKRYQKVNRYLAVLDVDGISPVTTQVLATIGSISFGAAGFFFSTFAGNAGFGNKDILYFLFSGIIDTAKQPASTFYKIGILLGLIVLVTSVTFLCNYLLNRLKKKSEEEIQSEVMLGAETEKKLEQIQYYANIKANNLYGFWLQLIPGIFIAGLVLLGIAGSSDTISINEINASSEGLIVGTSIAMSFAGLIYLYIIKIVEPRLVKRYDSDPSVQINWIKSNWELVAILIAFIVFSICVILIPYDPAPNSKNIIPLSQQTRYAVLLFIAICLVGSISFAYSVRSRGLIETSRFLEKVMRRLNSAIARCSSAEAPEIHNKVAKEHSNIIQHVLRQLSVRTNINSNEEEGKQKKKKERGFFEGLMDFIKHTEKNEQPVIPEPILNITLMQPWEERWFPDIVDKLKAVDFEYRIQKARVIKLEEMIADHRNDKAGMITALTQEIESCRSGISNYESQVEKTIIERSERTQRIKNVYNKTIVDLLDGFHLGIWYRENSIGPGSGYFKPPSSDPLAPINFLSSQ